MLCKDLSDVTLSDNSLHSSRRGDFCTSAFPSEEGKVKRRKSRICTARPS